ncbi:MAG: putative 26S proteasome regulatory subunit, partial [Thelocarpon superellum]
DLRQFPYYDNYVDLTRMEMHAIFSVILRQPRMIAFLGSGPLPLSSICLVEALHKHNPRCPVQIHNIDWDPIAVNLSSQLCQRLGGSCKAMRFACADIANELRDLREFDVIFLAALVGNSSAEKERIAASVSCRMRAGAIMVLRSSHSLRSLLYPVWARS